MHSQSILRLAGSIFACLGAGGLILLWSHAQDLVRVSGKGLRGFVEFAFLGAPISGVDLGLDGTFSHDTYYVVADPMWAWLSLFGGLAGIVMAACPQWLSKSSPRRG